MIFLRLSMINLQAVINLNLQSVDRKPAHHETYESLWDNFPRNFRNIIVLLNGNFLSPL